MDSLDEEAIRVKVVVTGGSGKAGRWVVRDLRQHDTTSSTWTRGTTARPTGSAWSPISATPARLRGARGADAVVHLAAIPAPDVRPPAETFRINTLSTYNVFAAAEAHGLQRVVWASSETVLGIPFEHAAAVRPHRPDHRAASRVVVCAVEARGRDDGRPVQPPDRIPFVGLRISNIIEPDDYAAFPSYWATRGSAGGTCGATSTAATSRSPAAWR